jgi:hypothetical protein
LLNCSFVTATNSTWHFTAPCANPPPNARTSSKPPSPASSSRKTTLKTRPLAAPDLADFIKCCRPANRHERVEAERFRYFSHADLVARDKASLDIFWLKDASLDNLDDLPPPEVLQQEIIEHLEAALASFRDVAAGLPRQMNEG